MPTQEEINQQKQLLDTHRRSLSHLLQQQATFTSYTPPYIVEGIRQARIGIEQSKQALRQWGVKVDPRPDDIELPQERAIRQDTALVERLSTRRLGIGGYYPRTHTLIIVGLVGAVVFLYLLLSTLFSSTFSSLASFNVLAVALAGFMVLLATGVFFHYSTFARVKWWNIERDRRGYLYVTKIEGTCLKCGGQTRLGLRGPDDQRRIVIVCQRNPGQHTWPFDFTTLPEIK